MRKIFMSTKMISREHNQKDFRINILLQFTLFSTRIFTIACSSGGNTYSDYVYQCFEFYSSICSFTSLKLW